MLVFVSCTHRAGVCPLYGLGGGRSDGVGLVASLLGDVTPSIVHMVHLKVDDGFVRSVLVLQLLSLLLPW